MERLVIGHGRPVLLVPGNDLCAEFYRPLAERLAAHGCATTLLTLPGQHGLPPLSQPGFAPLVDAFEVDVDADIVRPQVASAPAADIERRSDAQPGELAGEPAAPVLHRV